VHLLEFSIEIYYDARSYKRQICNNETDGHITEFSLPLHTPTLLFANVLFIFTTYVLLITVFVYVSANSWKQH